jgi:hypothetical protein
MSKASQRKQSKQQKHLPAPANPVAITGDNQNPTQVQLPPKAQAQKPVNNRPIQVQRAARKR